MLWFNFIFGLNFISLVLGYGNVYYEFKTKGNKIQTKDKIELEHIQPAMWDSVPLLVLIALKCLL